MTTAPVATTVVPSTMLANLNLLTLTKTRAKSVATTELAALEEPLNNLTLLTLLPRSCLQLQHLAVPTVTTTTSSSHMEAISKAATPDTLLTKSLTKAQVLIKTMAAAVETLTVVDITHPNSQIRTPAAMTSRSLLFWTKSNITQIEFEDQKGCSDLYSNTFN